MANDIGSALLQSGDVGDYAKLLAIQRRQALAQSLLEQGGQNAGSAAYGGLANAGKTLLGAFLAKRGDQDTADFYSGGQSQPPPTQGGVDPGQLTNMASQGQGPVSAPTPGQGAQAGTDPAPSPQASPQPPPQAQQMGPPSQPGAPPDLASLPPVYQKIWSGIPHLPGLSATQAVRGFMNDQAGYMKAYYDSIAQTPDQKNVSAAYGAGTPQAQQSLQGIVQKAGSTEVRPEGYVIGPGGKITYGPNEASNVYYTTGPNNEPIAHMIPGGAEAAAQTAGAIEAAKEGQKIIPDVQTSTGARIPMTGAQAIGSTSGSPQLPLGIRTNNPGNLQPGGQQAQYPTPQAGIAAMSNVLNSPTYQGKNTVASIISTYAPYKDKSGKVINDTPAYIADVAARMGVSPNQSLNKDDPAIMGTLMHSMIQHENGRQPYQQVGASPQTTPQIGESTAQAGINKATGDSAVGLAHAQAVTQSTLKAIDGLIALNDQTPDSTIMSPDWKADINKRAPALYKGDAGSLAQWNQLNGIGVLGGLKQLQGLGRLDLPEVNQVVKTNGVPADVPRAQRLQILQNLRTMVLNNLAATQNNVANLNQPGIAANQQQAPMGNYGAPNPQDIVNELRRRGLVK